MGELRAAGALADRPDAGSGRLKALVDADEAVGTKLDPGLVETDVGGVGNPADRHNEIAAFDRSLSVSRPQGHRPSPRKGHER